MLDVLVEDATAVVAALSDAVAADVFFKDIILHEATIVGMLQCVNENESIRRAQVYYIVVSFRLNKSGLSMQSVTILWLRPCSHCF